MAGQLMSFGKGCQLKSYVIITLVDTIEESTTDHLLLALLRGMMKVNTATRMSLEDVRRHPWFTRYNSLLADNGHCRDRLLLATKLMEGLHIDFSRLPLTLQENDFQRLSSTQPVHLAVGHQPLEDVRTTNSVSYSQPMGLRGRDVASTAPATNSWCIPNLRVDPTMSQFAPVPHVPPSLTQVARRFNEICPPQPLTKFYSLLPLTQLLPILSESLHRVGIVVPQPKPEVYGEDYDEQIWIKVQTMDSRRCPLSGDIIVGKVSPYMTSIEFTKAKGDPLEWRRFFKVRMAWSYR